jgi:hypothetical protein
MLKTLDNPPDQFEKKIIIEKKIIGCLLQQRQGVSVKQIRKYLGWSVTRQTIHNHLRRLMLEGMVESKLHLYFLKDRDFLDRYWFGVTMSECAEVLLNPNVSGSRYHNSARENQTKSFIIDLANEFKNPISQEHCKTMFGKSEHYEQFFFDFANRAGAYMVYIFLESLRPSEWDNHRIVGNKEKQNNRKKSLSNELIRESINLELLFKIFRVRLNQLNSNPLLDKKAKKGQVLAKETNDKIYENPEFLEFDPIQFKHAWSKFKIIYPNLYNGLEMCWNQATFYAGVEATIPVLGNYRRLYCPHHWKEVKVYKSKEKHFECHRCHTLVKEPLLQYFKK